MKISGEFHRTIISYNKITLPHKSTKIILLDCHLFYPFLNDSNPLKYMLQTPQLVYGAIKRTIQNVYTLQAKIKKDIEHISITLLKTVGASEILIANNTSS